MDNLHSLSPICESLCDNYVLEHIFHYKNNKAFEVDTFEFSWLIDSVFFSHITVSFLMLLLEVVQHYLFSMMVYCEMKHPMLMRSLSPPPTLVSPNSLIWLILSSTSLAIHMLETKPLVDSLQLEFLVANHLKRCTLRYFQQSPIVTAMSSNLSLY